jgi:hypothetical protein
MSTNSVLHRELLRFPDNCEHEGHRRSYAVVSPDVLDDAIHHSVVHAYICCADAEQQHHRPRPVLPDLWEAEIDGCGRWHERRDDGCDLERPFSPVGSLTARDSRRKMSGRAARSAISSGSESEPRDSYFVSIS